MDRSPYRVYRLNVFVKSFATREAALEFVYSHKDYEDYEILDRSDD